MASFTLNMYQTAGLAMLLFVLGRYLTNRVDFLKRCCIPAPVVGGLIFSLTHLALYMGGIIQLVGSATPSTLGGVANSNSGGLIVGTNGQPI